VLVLGTQEQVECLSSGRSSRSSACLGTQQQVECLFGTQQQVECLFGTQ
jgi:hypothetical protein